MSAADQALLPDPVPDTSAPALLANATPPTDSHAAASPDIDMPSIRVKPCFLMHGISWLPTRHSTWMAPTLLTAPPPMGSGRALPRSVVAAKSPSSFLPGWHKRRPVYKIIRPTIRDLRYHGRPRPHRRGCGATRGCAVTDLACGPRAGRDQLGESGTSHRFFITETRSTVYIRSRKHIQNRQGHK